MKIARCFFSSCMLCSMFAARLYCLRRFPSVSWDWWLSAYHRQRHSSRVVRRKEFGLEDSHPWNGLVSACRLGNKLFVSSAVADKDLKPKNSPTVFALSSSMGLGGLTPPPKVNIQWQLHCFECQSGEKLWSTTICEGQPKYPVHPSNTYATETPAAYDQGIVVFFGATVSSRD